MKLIWKYMRNYKKTLVIALFLATVNQVFSLLDIQVSRMVLDNYVLKASEFEAGVFVKGIFLLMALSFVLALVSRIAKSLQDYFSQSVTQKMGTNMYAKSVQHAFTLPYQLFEDQQSGELLQVLQKARDNAQELIRGLIDVVFFSLVGIAFVITYAFTIHWTVGIGFLSLIPILGASNYFLARRIKEIQRNIINRTADLSGSTTETLRNVELVKSMGLEVQEVERLNDVNDQILDLELEKVRTVRTLSFIQGTIIHTLRAALLFWLFWLIYTGVASFGEYFALFAYSFHIFQPLQQFGDVATKYFEAKASAEKLEDVFKLTPEKEPENPKAIDDIESVTFENVSFSYTSAKQHALENVDIEIKAGETVAFVGPSGSGKSTALKLLLGLYKPTEGTVAVNNIPTTDISYTAFKRRIGFVAQETQLFSGTIKENLLFVKPNATEEECITALKGASAESILGRASEGLGTRIGEGGLKLSGGERQRLAIARALLRNPEIVIFDEATSALDSITEHAITETINTIEQQRPDLMMVMVAHRLSTIKHAKHIYVFETGKVIEHGTHKNLLKEKGLYYALWREQMGNLSG